MKKILTAAGLVAIISFMAVAPAKADSDRKPEREKSEVEASSSMKASSTLKDLLRKHQIQGTVSAMATGTISVATPNGSNWTVNVSSDDKITSVNGIRISLDQVKVGHRVVVSGKTSSSSVIDASYIKDLSLHLKKGVIRGIISDLNAAAKSFTLILKNGSSISVNLINDAEVRVKNASSTATSTLQNGMVVNVKGYLNKAASSTFIGSEVRGGFHNDEASSSATSTSAKLKAKLYGWLRWDR